jgi:SAM-dependent methyltransferase
VARARRSGLQGTNDAFGHALADRLSGQNANVVLEREDGFIVSTRELETYFTPFRRWPAVERKAMRFVRGRVLDIGCGAGRVALHLQGRGHEVVGIDTSPGAVRTSKARGVKTVRQIALETLDERIGRFDTVIMLGNNFGLVGSPQRVSPLLRRISHVTSSQARIVAGCLDPYRTDDPDYLAYQRRNRARGRMPGQLRLRLRYRRYSTPWFQWLFFSPGEMGRLLEDTDWRIARLLSGEGSYVAILEKLH